MAWRRSLPQDGRVLLVCNHELENSRLEESAFDSDPALLPDFVRNNMYDAGNGVHTIDRWHHDDAV